MGISRDSRHKRALTGGRRNIHQKKRKYELARQASYTKIGTKRVIPIRVRGGNLKFRALRLDTGNFSWGTECCTRRARILNVVYNATNNELVRTKTLVKNAIVEIDSAPFRQWVEQFYGLQLGKKKATEGKEAEAAATAAGDKPAAPAGPVKKSARVLKKMKQRNKIHVVEPAIRELFNKGRLLACISSRPGQSGRADGYVVEGKELEFYQKKMQKKK